MTEPTSAQDLFKGRHFDQEIIILCVRWYITFKLSFRDLVQMMAARGITLSHTTILRWVQQYVPERCCVERLIFSKADRAVRSRRSANVFTILDSIVHN